MMSKAGFLDALAVRPLLADGAMGTQLMALGLPSGACGMEWNVSRPDAVRGIHAAYRAAGCDLITTNSFGGSAIALGRHGMERRTAELNRAAAQVARGAAGAAGWVLGDVGPCGDFLEPLGDLTAEELGAAFREQIAALLEGGADAVIIETMSDPAEMEIAIAAARGCRPDVPVIATYAFQKAAAAFRTLMGTGVGEAVARARDAGAAVVGANCGTGLELDDYVELCRELAAAAGDLPVIVQPNAGSPQLLGGVIRYQAAPEQMAATAGRLREAGARIIGGCCGTTPGHLAAMARALRA